VQPSKSNVYLIGPMGVGKTTVGHKLAHLIDFEFLDTDHELERRTGVTIAHIFEIEGEGGFRSRETRLLEEAAKYDAYVVATGGGAMLYDSNRKTIRESGKVIYLTASVEFLWDRVRHSTNRPLLHTEDTYATLREIYMQRDPIYRDVADHVIEISPTSEMTANRIAEWLDIQVS